jgi:non-heme chloroperoxidase
MTELKKSRLVARDGTELAVFEAGSATGVELIFLHGFAMNHSVWQRQFADERLSATCRMLAFDLRGHGESGKPSRADAYATGEIWADDLADVIEHCKLRRPIAIAWSFAGRTINDYLKKYGESRLAGINYIAAASIADLSLLLPDHVLPEQMCSEDPVEVELSAQKWITRIFGEEPGSATFNRLYDIATSTPANTKRFFRARPLDYAALLPTIALPVLATQGESDLILKPELMRRLAGIVKNGRASIYPEAGHAPFYDQANRFNAELLAFAKSCHQSSL